MLQLSDEELHAFELAVATAAQSHEEKSFRGDGAYTRVFNLADFTDKFNDFTIKYTDHVFIVKECKALERLYDLAVKQGSGGDVPHTPRVVHYFHTTDSVTGHMMGYIVMERILMREVSDDELCIAAVKAVRWLHAQKMDFFGSLGGANTFHTVFQGSEAPEPFTSVSAAQTYLNVAVDRIRQRRPKWRTPIHNIDVLGDDVVLTQSDMHACNFGVAVDGRPVVFDVATVQALPTTLAYFTLLKTTDFAKDVAAHLFTEDQKNALKASPNFESLSEVRNRLRMGTDDLGVDKDGNVRPHPIRRVSTPVNLQVFCTTSLSAGIITGSSTR